MRFTFNDSELNLTVGLLIKDDQTINTINKRDP